MTLSVDSTGHLSVEPVDDKQRMEISLVLYEPRREVVDAMLAAYNDPDWDYKKSDGCTLVSELHFPPGSKFPPCVLHDHWCWKASQAKTRKEADKIRRAGDTLFFRAMLDYGVNPVRAAARWSGVRFYWTVLGTWTPPKSLRP